MEEETTLVLTSYEKTCGDVEETRRWAKGPFAVGTAAAGVRAAAARADGHRCSAGYYLTG